MLSATNKEHKIKVIKLLQALDVTANLSGDVSGKFVDYTQQRNRELIENAFTKTVFFPRYSAEQLDTLSKYPDTFVCSK